MKRKIDPFTFEIMRHEMWEIIQEGRIALVRASGSPTTYGAYDFAVGISKSNGDSIFGGGGILHQVRSVSHSVKCILRNYEEDAEKYVPINDGDQFFGNDAYEEGLHSMDMAIVAPLFWEGKRIAWVGATTHHADTGGIDVGGFCLRATEIYQEGIRTPGVKIVSQGNVIHDVFKTIITMIREPDYAALEIKAKIASCNVMKERVLDIIKHYGIDTFLEFAEQVIDNSTEMAKAKLREIPDGEWQAVMHVDADWRTDRVYKLVCTVRKEEEHFTIDYTGTSEEASNSPINLTWWGTFNCLMPGPLVILFHDIPWNEGIIKVFDVNIPEGSILNCRFPAPISASMPAGAACMVHYVTMQAISKMLGSSEKYKHEACAVWAGGWIGSVLYGKGRGGRFFNEHIQDSLAGGGGAVIDRDGCNSGCYISSPYNIIPNVETHEMLSPYLLLARREFVDGGGPGKFRGGVPVEYVFTPHGSQDRGFNMTVVGTNGEARNSLGIFGGYPAPNSQATVLRNTNVLELLKCRVPEYSEIRGERLDYYAAAGLASGPEMIKDGDVVRFICPGGGGWGDPIERDAELVVEDVVNGYVSVEMAKECYGVAIGPRTMALNKDKTDKLREEIRKERFRVGRRPK